MMIDIPERYKNVANSIEYRLCRPKGVCLLSVSVGCGRYTILSYIANLFRDILVIGPHQVFRDALKEYEVCAKADFIRYERFINMNSSELDALGDNYNLVIVDEVQRIQIGYPYRSEVIDQLAYIKGNRITKLLGVSGPLGVMDLYSLDSIFGDNIIRFP